MNELLARAAGVFVAPAPPTAVTRTETRAPREPASRALVLGAPAAVLPVAAALAGGLRASSRDGAALLCAVLPDDGPGPPDSAADAEAALPAEWGRAGVATAPARRLAARLRSRELESVARGRLAWLALGGAPADALTGAQRAMAAVSEPAVLAVCGPRPAELDPWLDEHDLVVLVAAAGSREAVLDLAVAELERRTRVPVTIARPLSRAARALAVAGWSRLPAAERELHGVIEGLA